MPLRKKEFGNPRKNKISQNGLFFYLWDSWICSIFAPI